MKSGSIRKAVTTVLVAAMFACRREQSATEKLLALAPHAARPIEARLTGFDWPPMRLQRAAHASLLDPARLELAGAAGAVVQSLLNDSSARARHEAGAAYLLIERDRDAIEALQSAVQESPNDAAAWNDLAAARYTLAVTEKRPHELPQALADADHALRLNPRLPEALFNRALIIEALGVTEAARRAWQRYAAVDPSTHWSTEALNHLGNLRVVTTRDEFQHQLTLATSALRAGNHAPIVALARNYPQEARTWSETLLLGQWADAIHKGDAKKAIETLAVVRELGAALVEFNQVHSVSDIVAAIDHADPSRIQILADAHAIYLHGRLQYSKRRIAEAEGELRQSRDLFRRAGSPMAIIADYYLANCVYDNGHPADAIRAFDAVAASFDAARYPGLAAEIGWERTLCHAATGQWDAAIRTATESRKIFSKLGEIQNRAEMDLLLASNLNHTSQPAAAWKARVAAFSVLNHSSSTERLRNSLITAVNAEISQGHFEAALALSRVALDDLHQARQPIGVSLAEAARAEVLAKIGDSRAARDAIERARRSAATIPNTELRRRASAAIDIADGVIERDANPGTSLKLLDAAVAYYNFGRRTTWLPNAYLERGRTYVRAKNDNAALTDFEAGIRQLDLQRASISNTELRGSFYDTEPELFSEAIALLLRRGDMLRAFEFSDGARARSLYDQLGSRMGSPLRITGEQLQHSLQPKTVVVEYALLPDSIAIFYFSSSHSGVVRVANERSRLRALVERCRDLLQRQGDRIAVQRTTGALYKLLIEPITAQLTGADRLVVVPDRQLHGIPFAALYNTTRGRYLLDDFIISIAPSAESILERRTPYKLAPVLVVGDPRDENESSLPEATHESEAIAAIYDSPTLLTGDSATRARFITAAKRSSIIHYAGHADTNMDDRWGTLHFAAAGSGDGDLEASDIAELHLGNAPIVILAACGTMRGESEHVEGMPSMARAFLAAGARSVVGTLWEVDDDTAPPLFAHIHRDLRHGVDISVALRNAQMAFAHSPDPRLRHPSTWAPVEVLGYSNEQRPPSERRSD